MLAPPLVCDHPLDSISPSARSTTRSLSLDRLPSAALAHPSLPALPGLNGLIRHNLGTSREAHTPAPLDSNDLVDSLSRSTHSSNPLDSLDSLDSLNSLDFLD